MSKSPERKSVEVLIRQLSSLANEMKVEHRKMKLMMKNLETKTVSTTSSSRNLRNSVTSDRTHRNRSYSSRRVSQTEVDSIRMAIRRKKVKLRTLRNDLREILIVLRDTISRNPRSVLSNGYIDQIQKILPEMSPFRISDDASSRKKLSKREWGLDSDATVGEVLEAMHERIFGYSGDKRDVDTILAVTEKETRGKEQIPSLPENQNIITKEEIKAEEVSFPLPPDMRFRGMDDAGQQELNEMSSSLYETEHFEISADPPGMQEIRVEEESLPLLPPDMRTRGIDDAGQKKLNEMSSSLHETEHFEISPDPPGLNEDFNDEKDPLRTDDDYYYAMTPPPGIPKEQQRHLEWIDETERERRRLESARKRSDNTDRSVLSRQEALEIGQRNNFGSPKGVVMDFSKSSVSSDAHLSHERAVRKRIRERHKLKVEKAVRKSDESDVTKEEEKKTEINQTSVALERLQQELKTSQSKVKELEEAKMRLTSQMSRISTHSSKQRIVKRKEEGRKLNLAPLSLENTWISTSASKLPRANVIFEKSVMSSFAEGNNERDVKQQDTQTYMSEKEMDKMRSFREKYGSRRLGADVEPIDDEQSLMSSKKRFHEKIMGMSNLSLHPEPYSGVQSPHARLWDFKPSEYKDQEALNSNVLIKEIEDLKDRTPRKKRR